MAAVTEKLVKWVKSRSRIVSKIYEFFFVSSFTKDNKMKELQALLNDKKKKHLEKYFKINFHILIIKNENC